MIKKGKILIGVTAFMLVLTSCSSNRNTILSNSTQVVNNMVTELKSSDETISYLKGYFENCDFVDAPLDKTYFEYTQTYITVSRECEAVKTRLYDYYTDFKDTLVLMDPDMSQEVLQVNSFRDVSKQCVTAWDLVDIDSNISFVYISFELLDNTTLFMFEISDGKVVNFDESMSDY